MSRAEPITSQGPPDLGFGERFGTGKLLLLIAAVPLVLLIFRMLLMQRFDPREPPVLQPRVPFVGHVLSLVRESSTYFHRLHKARPTPICTLPMLNGKVYLVHSPSLVQAVMRSKDISFDPLFLRFGQNVGGLSDKQMEIFKDPDVLKQFTDIIHSSLTANALESMIASGVVEVKTRLNGIPAGPGIEIPHVFKWVREVASKAAMRGLFGEKNVLDNADLEDLWTFDQTFNGLLFGVAPSILGRKAYQSRARLQKRLGTYYRARYDEGSDVSGLIQRRAALERHIGWTDEQIGVSEFGFPWAAITSTNLTLMWLFVSVFSQPRYVDRIRDEVLAITTITTTSAAAAGGRVATVQTAKFEKHCPVLMAFHREVLRLYNDNMGNRMVLRDTFLQDADGRAYLLKKDTQVQWVAGILHLDETLWGDDAREFNPDRWLQATPQQERARRGAHIPFGGGKNLCPGRNFALAENLAFVGATALGFNVEGVTVPGMLAPALGAAMRTADWEGRDPSLTIRRRKGWEDVVWDFDVST